MNATTAEVTSMVPTPSQVSDELALLKSFVADSLLRPCCIQSAYLAKRSHRFRCATRKVQHRAESIHTPDKETHEAVFDARYRADQAHHRLFRFQRRGHRLLLRLRSSSPFGHHNPGSGVRSLDLHPFVFPIAKEVRSQSFRKCQFRHVSLLHSPSVSCTPFVSVVEDFNRAVSPERVIEGPAYI